VIFLKEYVKGAIALPKTTQGIIGLPRAWRRGKASGLTSESQPNFLFLDLPETPTDNTILEQFGSNVILRSLETTEVHGVPIFSISGYAKTRSVMEMLCLQWGFYFNALEKDHGSDDLSFLARYIDKEISSKQDLKKNTATARKVTLLLFLSRLLILRFCLSVSGCRDTFSSKSWALLQVCPVMFTDVFSTLFNHLLSHLDPKIISETTIWAVVRNNFVSIKEQLINMNYPNFSTNTKLKL
jgi:hypothetical protein